MSLFCFLWNRIAEVCSKTKESRKVFTLFLSREALSKNSKNTWKVLSSLKILPFCYFIYYCKVQQIGTFGLQTAGGVRDPSEEEIML